MTYAFSYELPSSIFHYCIQTNVLTSEYAIIHYDTPFHSRLILYTVGDTVIFRVCESRRCNHLRRFQYEKLLIGTFKHEI